MNDSGRGLLDLIIARIPSLKPRERAALCTVFSTEEDFLCCTDGAIRACLERQAELNFDAGFLKTGVLDEARRAAERDKKLMESRQIGYVSLAETAYPPLLREIYDPPALLYYLGRFAEIQPTCAVVGTRKPSAAVLETVYHLSRRLGEAGVAVVSGLALGVDAMAHRGNLEGGGHTVAVLGSAVDMLYPAANRQLARRILDTGGLILSEYPPGTSPRKWYFPERNRIITGLCPAVLVAEAPAKSGALITADFALEQNRDLYVAADDNGPFGEGCRKLAEEGAPLIKCADTLLEALHIRLPEKTESFSGDEESLSGALAKELGIFT